MDGKWLASCQHLMNANGRNRRITDSRRLLQRAARRRITASKRRITTSKRRITTSKQRITTLKRRITAAS
ncbi:hypothetical protein CBR_g39807 [Chara braunii]|uniref:Uncharacterized protein n=1 Tax=Chara braunii TaxID=69332 RepID=A0A388LSJ9_CHABU|nr:hypothetical protein CBR_g39807 [Chara braunii]|eukprot:GBG85241.1 hypothetical protein CBR_g39807 [Chara braunii]